MVIPKLKYEHLKLTSFSKMRVDLAAQVAKQNTSLVHNDRITCTYSVLSNSVSKCLELFVGDEASETVKFTDMFSKFFDCLNVSNFVNGKHSRNPFKSPFRGGKDFRLKVHFVKYSYIYICTYKRKMMGRISAKSRRRRCY